jgi:hypothetical protein
MTFVKRNGAHVLIKQIPFVLLFVTAFFTIPILGYALFHLIRGSDAEAKYFCLVFGSLLLWACLEFVATRERFEIDLDRRSLIRRVSGVFKQRKTSIDLHGLTQSSWRFDATWPENAVNIFVCMALTRIT